MNTERIRIDKRKARELYQKYKTHQHYSQPLDREIQRCYQLIAQGRMVIKALESIRLAGLGEDKYPRLAICRADRREAEVRMQNNGSATMSATGRSRARGLEFSWPENSFPRMERGWMTPRAAVPIIPVYLRPKRALQNYHVLWEAEWRPVPPRDPMLLRLIGGDMWLVVAAWDLTEVERAAMATRLSA